MALTITPLGLNGNGSAYNVGSQQYDMSQKVIWFDFLITLSGSYTTGGDTLDFTTVAPLGYSLGGDAPTSVELHELVQAGATPTGFLALYCPSSVSGIATQAGGAVQFFGGAAASGQGLTQLAAGTYASSTPSLNGAVFKGTARFIRNVA